MAKVICIAGESGAGKTTSLRNLNPKETFIIDADKKGLSWRGWRKQYNSENKNYAVTSKPDSVIYILDKINTEMKHIKVAIIDTIGTIMISDEMRRAKEKGFDKWTDLASCIWNIIDTTCSMRNDLTIVFIAHTQTDYYDNGTNFTKIKTSGKKLEKIGLETRFNVVLLAKCIEGEHFFEVHANNSTARTPLGLYEEMIIPNDISKVIEDLEKYENNED